MVIKKPYAFLIKHFRLIHGLLFGVLVFLFIQSVNIYTFFNNYAVSHNYLNQAGLADTYITPLMIILNIVAILIALVIYLILQLKDKSNRIYLASILYYIILIIFFIYTKTVFTGLETKYMDIESVRLLRDVSLIILLPQILFLFIIFGRTLGFNIKQFEFKKDLEELQIDVSDSEEVELTVGNDTYKIARFFRKFLRLTKYFMLENKLFVIAVSSLFILGISIFIYSRINIYQESYTQDQEIRASSLWFNINQSYKTNADMNNIVISEGKHYLLVDVTVTNKNNTSYNLSRDIFRLEVNNELIIPSFSVSDKFSDIGNTFDPGEIKAGITKEFIVIFEIPSEFSKNTDFLLKIKNLENTSTKTTYYKDIIITPIDLNIKKDMGTYQLPCKIDLKDSLLKNSTLEIDSFDIAEKFKEPYKHIIDGKEKDAIFSVIPKESNRGSVLLLKLKSRLALDDSIFLNKYIKYPRDLYDMYGILQYRLEGNYYNVKLKKLDVDYELENNAYMEIPIEMENANRIDLVILIRGVKYTINLK